MLLNKYNFAVADFAPKDNNRYTLNAIQISESGTAATNGHYLVTVSAPIAKRENFPTIDGFKITNAFEPFLLGRDAAKLVEKSIPSRESIPVLNNAAIGEAGESTLSIAVTDLGDKTQVFRPRKVTGSFPDYSKVIPNDDPAFEIALDAGYLEQLAKAAKQFSDIGNSDQAVLLRFYGHDKPIVMQTKRQETEQTWTGVLMPMALSTMKDVLYPKKATVPEPEQEMAAD